MIRLPWQKRATPAPHDRSAAEGSDTGDSSGLSGSTGVVRGERGFPIVGGARSLQSRMSSLLAAALMISVGAGMLAWYYAEALSRPAAVRSVVRAPLPENAGEGMTLPSFGAIVGPSVTRATPSAPSAKDPSSPSAPVPRAVLFEPPLSRAPPVLPRRYGSPAQRSPRARALERRLAGAVFAAAGAASGVAPAVVDQDARTRAGDALRTLLQPSVLDATSAQVLPTQRLLLPKGAFIDCTLETAIDSTLPGMTTCVTATDTFGADGTVVLLERGTKLIGETRGEVRQGQARVFVVWTEARTPTGVVVQLDSPGADALGRSGLEGKVNRHFWQRFGAAALVSMIDGAVQAQVQSSSRGGTVILDPTASEDVLTEILRSTVDIPPTVRVRNGSRIQVLVARDVDFRSVYELTPVSSASEFRDVPGNHR